VYLYKAKQQKTLTEKRKNGKLINYANREEFFSNII